MLEYAFWWKGPSWGRILAVWVEGEVACGRLLGAISGTQQRRFGVLSEGSG